MESSRYEALTVNIVKEYAWCPAHAWFSWNGPKPVLPGFSRVPRGNLDPLEAKLILERLGHRGHIIMEAVLEDEVLGVRGRVDYLAEPDNGPGAVLEYKFRGIWGDAEIVQTALYTVMAEHRYKAAFKGYIVSVSGVRVITEGEKREGVRLVYEARRAIEGPEPPEPGHDLARCRACVYRRICPWPGR